MLYSSVVGCSSSGQELMIFNNSQEMMANVSGRIPQSVEKHIKNHMSLYARNVTSMLAQFPSQEIALVIDG